ncbi:MAG TPA: hypothetical protein VJV74_08845 [Terriglobia bacterium]|nr:hypothetical protein [Terriglobia bacterium]
MKRIVTWAGIAAVSLAVASLAFAAAAEQKSKGGPLTGTWECTSHGGGTQEGSTPFTLDLQQDGETVTGSVSSPEGGTDITSATFKDNVLEIHLDTPDGLYILKATLKGGELKGSTTHDGNPMGTWEGKKSAASGDKAGN